MVKSDTSEFEGALDFADELDVDLYQLVDTVLDEIEEAKQKNITKDSDDQIMPSASPTLYETDLMDDLDTPFHHDGGETSFGSHKSVSLSHQEHGFSPDNFEDSWSFDYIDEISRKDNFFNNPYNQNDDKYGHSYNGTSKASVAVDYSQSVKSVPAASSHLSANKLNFEQSSTSANSNSFEYQSLKRNASRDVSANAEPNKDYHSLKQCQDLSQVLYHDSVQQNLDISSRHHQLHRSSTGQSQQHGNQQNLQGSIFQDEDSCDGTTGSFLSWTCKHPENWSEAEVLDWLYYSAERNGIDCSLLPGEAFHSVTGRDLCRMGVEDFQSLEPQFGQFFYSLFRQQLNGLRFQHPSDILDTEPHIAIPDEKEVQRYLDNSLSPRAVVHGHQQGEIYYQTQVSSPASPDSYYPYQQTRHYDSDYGTSSGFTGQSIVDSRLLQVYDYSPEGQALKYENGYGYDYPSQSQQGSERSSYHPYKIDKKSVMSTYAGVVTPRRRPGRPRIKNLPTEEELRLRQEKKLKSQHLWEFIFDLLNNPTYNPQVLKWENQREGVFRFIQSETIAQLWGNLKNNENMTYEKLSRAMRHYYKRGILERVEGRRLVYKFSITTLQRMQEKRQAAYQKASNEIAAVSKVTQRRQEEKCMPDMQTASENTTSNTIYPHSDDRQIVYMRTMSGDVSSVSGGALQLSGGDRVHPHVLSSHDISELSDINFQRMDEHRMPAIHELSNNHYTSATDMRILNVGDKNDMSIETPI